MVSENIVNIILKMEDQATQVAQKAEQTINKLGNTAQSSNNKAASSTQKLTMSYDSAAKKVGDVVTSAERVGQIGSKQFDRYNDSVQKSIVNFNRLDSETQDMLRYLNQMSDKGREAFIGMSSKAQEAVAKLEALENETKSWGNTLDFTKTKMQLMGTNVDSLKGKIQVVGSTIKAYVGNSWDSIKGKITSAANHVTTSFSNALNNVKSKISALGNSFNGLGGIIASAMGGLGLAGVGQLTIGLAMTREQMSALTQATLGSADAANQMINGIKGGFEGLDSITNNSLVSLNDLGQAMNTIKMSTGMSNEQLQQFSYLVNDVGQRAILMGKDSNEALSLMQAAGRGLNGEFDLLRSNFGITADKLKELGWSGAASDVEGYQRALEHALEAGGNMNEMMNTTPGLIALVKKQFTSAGRQIGEIFIPYIREALQWFLDLKKTCPEAAKYLILVAGAISLFTTLAPMLAPIVTVLGFINLQFIGIVAVAAAVAVAIYNAGKAFGWWKDVQTMMEAIIAGLRRLFDAFRNSPVVKQAIEDIKNVFYGLLGIIQTIGGPLTDILSKNDDGTIDIVHSLVEFFEQWGSTIYEVTKLVLGLYLTFKAYNTIKDVIGEIIWKYKDLKDEIEMAKDKIIDLKNKLSESWNEGKLNTIKQKFSEIKDKIVDAKGKLVEFISKMRENAADKLEILKIKFSELKDKILLAKDKLIDLLSRIREIAAEKIATLADKFRSLADGISLAGIKAKLYAAYQWLVNAATAVWNALLDMNPIMIVVIAIMALVAALIYLYNTNDTVKAAIDGLFAALSGVGEFLMGSVVPAFQWLWDVLQPVGEFLMSVFAPVWDIIVQVLTIVWNTIMGISDAFGQFLSGQIDLPNLLLGIWGLLSQAWIQIMTIIGTAILNFAMQVWNYAVQAGTNMLNGVITYISQLPGRFWSYLVQTTSRVIAAGMQWVNSAKQKASEMVNAAVTNVQGLPGKIYTEFSKIPGKIQEAAMKAIQAAADFGKKIIDAVLSAMGIHSPGIAQVSITEEFKGIIGKIKDAIKPAGEYAKQVGSAIVDNFGEPKLSMDTEDLMPYYDLDANPLENVDMANIDLSTMAGGLDSATGMTEETNTMIGESYAQLAMMMQNTLNGMVLADQVAYGNIQTNDITTFQAISTSLNLNLLTMSNNLRTQLNNMLITHKNAMTSANITTRQQLSSMLSETTRVVAEMRSAWSVMADSIISAAARIKNEATAYFNQLSNTIGTFYRKLQNPSQWAGGGSTGSASTVRSTGRDPGVMTRLTRSVANSLRRDNQLPYTISAIKATQSGIINPSTLEYMNLTPSSRVDILDLLQRGACPNCFAGGWMDAVNPNVSHIKNTARQWQMKGPAIQTGVGPIDTGMAFHVYDFEKGTPAISWGSFVRIADALAAAIPYDYYYNSDKYGSWQNALAHGAWNCYDGACAMVALANTCGFGGSVFCGGNWGSDGHCWAEINGCTFDTTARRQRGGWTAGPCNYRLPAPSAGGINLRLPNRSSPPKVGNPLEGLFNEEKASYEEVKLTLEHNVNVNVEGDTGEIDTDDLIRQLTASVTDKSLIDKIADALIRRDKRIARMGGA